MIKLINIITLQLFIYSGAVETLDIYFLSKLEVFMATVITLDIRPPGFTHPQSESLQSLTHRPSFPPLLGH